MYKIININALLFGCQVKSLFTKEVTLQIPFSYISVKPEERPSVVGFKPRHRVGDKLHMTCYINNTFPAANLTWFVAGKTVIILSLFEDIHSILNVGQNV